MASLSDRHLHRLHLHRLHLCRRHVVLVDRHRATGAMAADSLVAVVRPGEAGEAPLWGVGC